MKIRSELEIYKENGKETPIGYDEVLGIENGDDCDHVVVTLRGRSITVLGRELVRAAESAMKS